MQTATQQTVAQQVEQLENKFNTAYETLNDAEARKAQNEATNAIKNLRVEYIAGLVEIPLSGEFVKVEPSKIKVGDVIRNSHGLAAKVEKVILFNADKNHERPAYCFKCSYVSGSTYVYKYLGANSCNGCARSPLCYFQGNELANWYVAK